jgi:hypothetical protein
MSYVGEWKDGKRYGQRHGKGILRLVDGTVYNGDWNNEKEIWFEVKD